MDRDQKERELTLLILFIVLMLAMLLGCARPKKVLIEEMYPKCRVIGDNDEGFTILCPETEKLIDEMRNDGDNQPSLQTGEED